MRRVCPTLPLALICMSLLVSCGTAARDSPRGVAPPGKPNVTSERVSPTAEGTSSTPGVFALPQIGAVSFRCDRAFRVQPLFDTHGATSEEAVTIRAGNVTRRNFTTRTVGYSNGMPLRETHYAPNPVLTLPYAHYDKVVFTARTGTEARALAATVTARFVDGVVKRNGAPPLGGCYVKHWSASMSVSPY